jgi:hypothetical protein
MVECFDVDRGSTMHRKMHGCSLKIHRVESALLTESSFGGHRAVGNILIASTNIQRDRKIAIEYGERDVRSLGSETRCRETSKL